MKLIRIAQEQEFIHEDEHEARKALETEQDFPRYHTADILEKITPLFKKRINSNYLAGGATGVFEFDDGQAYKIVVTPYLAKVKQTPSARSDEDICPICRGYGAVDEHPYPERPLERVEVKCTHCKGTGYVADNIRM